jgi:hypothetical protein
MKRLNSNSGHLLPDALDRTRSALDASVSIDDEARDANES